MRFITHTHVTLPDGRSYFQTSRRMRKGLPGLHDSSGTWRTAPCEPSRRAHWLRFWEIGKLSWWISILFMIGSLLFCLAGLAAIAPTLPGGPYSSTAINRAYWLGAVFFTPACLLQWLQSMNADVAEYQGPDTPLSGSWHWWRFRPHNLGWLSAAIQFAGTLLFNATTTDALLPDLAWMGENMFVWTPNMVGSVCFFVSSWLACREIYHGKILFQPRNLGWWITMFNLAGSVFFLISALLAFFAPDTAHTMQPLRMWWSNFFTLAGALCFLIAAYLLLPEMFEQEDEDAGPACT